MPEVILNLPLYRSTVKSCYHDLFLGMSDGQIYKVKPTEFRGSAHNFLVNMRGWANRRGLKVSGRVLADGSVCCQMEKLT